MDENLNVAVGEVVGGRVRELSELEVQIARLMELDDEQFIGALAIYDAKIRIWLLGQTNQQVRTRYAAVTLRRYIALVKRI